MTSNILLITFPLHQSLLKILMYYFHFTKFMLNPNNWISYLECKKFQKTYPKQASFNIARNKVWYHKVSKDILHPLGYECTHKKGQRDSLSETEGFDFIPFQLHQHFAICGQWAYCWNHKTGSTTILDMLVRQCGYHDILEIHKIDLQR